jgi:hypothetical protein
MKYNGLHPKTRSQTQYLGSYPMRSVGFMIHLKHFQALGKNTVEMMPLVFSI